MSVVITGIGMLTPYGLGFATFASAAFAGKSAFGPITVCDVSDAQMQWAGECKQLEQAPLLNRKLKKMITRKDHLAMAAAHDAWLHAGLAEVSLDPTRMGVFVGACSTQIGDFFPYFEQVMTCVSDDRTAFDSARLGPTVLREINPIAALKVLANGALAHIAQTYNLQGPNTNVMNFGTGGLEAVQLAAESIELGDADLCLAGGMYAPLDPFQLADGVVQKEFTLSDLPLDLRVKPYAVEHTGTIPTEAAVFFVLESAEHAQARQAPVWGRLTKWSKAASGQATDGRALHAAVQKLGERPAQTVGCAHGHAYIDGWEYEALGTSQALTSIFGRFGYPGEASGLVQIATAITCQTRDTLVPTFNAERAEMNEPRPLQGDRTILASTMNRYGGAAAMIIAPV